MYAGSPSIHRNLMLPHARRSMEWTRAGIRPIIRRHFATDAGRAQHMPRCPGQKPGLVQQALGFPDRCRANYTTRAFPGWERRTKSADNTTEWSRRVTTWRQARCRQQRVCVRRYRIRAVATTPALLRLYYGSAPGSTHSGSRPCTRQSASRGVRSASRSSRRGPNSVGKALPRSSRRTRLVSATSMRERSPMSM